MKARDQMDIVSVEAENETVWKALQWRTARPAMHNLKPSRFGEDRLEAVIQRR